MDKRYQVFISSTFVDLINEPSAVAFVDSVMPNHTRSSQLDATRNLRLKSLAVMIHARQAQNKVKGSE